MRFRRALRKPRETQLAILKSLLDENRETAFGRKHRFGEVRTYSEFAERVPTQEYENLSPWIERIMEGEQNVLTRERVTHLIPTSGTSSGRKLIPFTARLQRELDAAIAPWITDLFSQNPGVLGGPAYWSITPRTIFDKGMKSAVQVGFESDAAYLGGMKSRLIDAVMVVPSGAATTSDLEEFRFITLRSLMEARELRLISVWHPSFLTLLLDDLPRFWRRLKRDLAGIGWKKLSPEDPSSIWPKLRVVSCWGDGHAHGAFMELQRRFPGVLVQRKGLIATEAFVSIPFGGEHPLAISSHFLEFVDEDGNVRLADELRPGVMYEIVVTTGGGLWRYKLRDRVSVHSRLENTPSVKFVGRVGRCSDLCGEKLEEEFVARCIQRLGGDFHFAMLAPCMEGPAPHYLFFHEGACPGPTEALLDEFLSENPHYAYARELRQLGPVRMVHMDSGAYELYSRDLVARGARLGEIKPVALSKEIDWLRRFKGEAGAMA